MDATLTQKSEGAYDRTTGAVTQTSPATFATKIVRHGLDFGRGAFFDQVEGVTIQKGDEAMLLAASNATFEPRPGDQVDVQGVTWIIMRAKRVVYRDDVVSYDLHVRTT